ncbi:endonuclease/exonuclease/phosphatase family protein [Actinocorallia sp. A-T 12471]|uniref:endonuclease/exonuclease/phosphatase family protein n=1 Tax=Actinocorallia sp. A-T 12471 TaxID=3089813 RepID=UPI0029D15876|nr:endonuclease/exonuclease/phosphatase family protein [Actinocorallia sp. A-T 12471]MDX6741458.1 endonuclease/exonuclease/phosphatase family protein [Actinocorallia sp. A-T 12471]
MPQPPAPTRDASRKIHRPPGVGRARRAVLAASRPEPWRRGPVPTALALLLGLLMLAHAQIPNRPWNLGSLVETFLPWLGLGIPVLLAGSLWRRSASAVVALLLPLVVWTCLFGGLLVDKSHPDADLTVATHNVGAANPDPVGTARALAAFGADLLALEELTPQTTDTYRKELGSTYPHHAVLGTVGLWSKLPLSDTQPIDIMNYGPLKTSLPPDRNSLETRALRTTVTTENGTLTVFVAHLGSVRLTPKSGFWTGSRNIGVEALGKAIAAEQNDRVILLGDLNGTTDDRALAPITSQMRPAQKTAGQGFGFTWPAAFPVVRADEILTRTLTLTTSRTLPATPSDHLPIAATITW